MPKNLKIIRWMLFVGSILFAFPLGIYGFKYFTAVTVTDLAKAESYSYCAGILLMFVTPPLSLLCLWFSTKQLGLRKFVIIVAIVWFIMGMMVWTNSFPYERRSNVSRVKADMRSLAAAIEAYFVDHNAYPPCTFTGPYAAWNSQEKMPSFIWTEHGIGSLTTPVGYITSHFSDPFRRLTDLRTFAYYTTDTTWVLISPGPDCIFDTPPSHLNAIMHPDPFYPSTEMINLTYDPTNGIYSSGDVFRIKQ